MGLSYQQLVSSADLGFSIATNDGLIECVYMISPRHFVSVVRRYFKDIILVGAFVLVASIVTDWVWVLWLGVRRLC